MLKQGTFILLFSVCLLVVPLNYSFSQPEGWTHFRGSNLDGISTDGYAPIVWNDTLNVEWKVNIHDVGWSSPVVLNDQIWVTTASRDGKKHYAVCIDYNTGKTVHDIVLFEPDSVYRKHSINTYATPTPCIEEGFVYVHFGRYGTACIRTDNGKVAWKRDDLQCEHIQGPGSSPILYKDNLILHLEGSDVQYIVALDKKTGKTVWKTERPKELYDKLEYIGKKAYITPLVINVNGQDQLISNGSAVCIAYDPTTGKEIWRFIKGEDSTIAMPGFENGIVYFYTGFTTAKEGEKYATLVALDPTGKGDITNTHVIWEKKSPILQLSTQLIKDGLLYTIDSESNITCMDAKTGKEIWSERLTGKYNSSPIYCNGKIFFSSTRGKTHVIEHGSEYITLSENLVRGQIWSTPAIYKNSLLLRTSVFLYKIHVEFDNPI